jgi:hypothetical protein
MRSHKELLVEPGNKEKLSDKIKLALRLERNDYGKQQGWDEIGTELEVLFKKESS